MSKYTRIPLEVTAEKYAVGKGMEDGFRLLSQIVTNDGLNTDKIVKITRPDGTIVCPYVQNRRGLVFIEEDDYIICETDNEKHVCGADRFSERFQAIE
jgi:hypothetical protein